MRQFPREAFRGSFRTNFQLCNLIIFSGKVEKVGNWQLKGMGMKMFSNEVIGVCRLKFRVGFL
jgi:hypothetical protein